MDSIVDVQKSLDLTTTEGKMALAEVMLKEEQVNCPIVHRFGPGVYIREGTYPANTLIVGQEHVSEHINMLLKGSINVIDSTGKVVTLKAPYMFVAPPGSKIGYTLEEVTWQNIYATTETDVEVLEKTLFRVPDMFKKHLANQLQEQIIKHEEDRQDFQSMLKETGWKEKDVLRLSHYREDCIPFPHGSYSVAPGDSPIQGKGLFCTSQINVNEFIAPMRLNGLRTPAGYLVNHAKEPNAMAVKMDNGDMYLVAIKNIGGMSGASLGEEITVDYRQVMQLNNLWNGENKCLQ
jgi:hypothetical protein